MGVEAVGDAPPRGTRPLMGRLESGDASPLACARRRALAVGRQSCPRSARAAVCRLRRKVVAPLPQALRRGVGLRPNILAPPTRPVRPSGSGRFAPLPLSVLGSACGRGGGGPSPGPLLPLPPAGAAAAGRRLCFALGYRPSAGCLRCSGDPPAPPVASAPRRGALDNLLRSRR